MNEIIFDFFDQLVQNPRYASFDYELAGYKRSEMVKLDFCSTAKSATRFNHRTRTGRTAAGRWRKSS